MKTCEEYVVSKLETLEKENEKLSEEAKEYKDALKFILSHITREKSGENVHFYCSIWNNFGDEKIFNEIDKLMKEMFDES